MNGLLEELEAATRALQTLDLTNVSNHRAALARRAEAARAMAAFCDRALATLPKEQCEELRERLHRVQAAGNVAVARLTALKQQAAGEWSRWHHVGRALETAASPTAPVHINCKG